MATTTPDSIYFPTANDQVAPLETVFATMASSVQTALTGTRAIYTYRWANTAARNAQVGMRAGDRGWQTDTSTEYIYLNNAWKPYVPFGQAAGTVTYSNNLGSGSFLSPINVTFPTGRFSQPPIVSVVCSNTRVTAGYSNKTATGFRIEGGNWSGGTANGAFTFDWTAVQMTSANATG